MIEPIVSLAGGEALHARADAFNRRRSHLICLEDDLDRVRYWNNYERYEDGFFSDKTHAPLPTAELVHTIGALCLELVQERAAIVALAEGTVRP